MSAQAILERPAVPSDRSLEQVREILFGADSRCFENERREATQAQQEGLIARLEKEVNLLSHVRRIGLFCAAVGEALG